MHHDKLECHVTSFLCALFKVKVTVRGYNYYYYNQNMTVYTKLMILLQPNLV